MVHDTENAGWGELRAEALEDAQETVRLRRRIHEHPELDFDLPHTAGIVEAELSALGIPSRRCAQTGVIGVLHGSGTGRTVGLRADMDALPVREESGRSFASKIPGVMHACGHDIHVAGALGSARLLARRREAFRGSVVFLFQPAEETSGGALPMIRDGALDSPRVEAVFSFHCSPDLAAGTIGVAPGRFRAASDMLDFRITGKGCHGAEPQRGTDAILAAAHVVCSLQHAVSRMTDPNDSAVLTVGEICGGTARNIVADCVTMKGILRTLSSATRARLLSEVGKIACGVASAFGAECTITHVPGYPCLVNDAVLTELVATCAAGVIGGENVQVIREPSMGVDDFACFLERVPGSYFLLGTASAAGAAPLHSPRFDPDERSIPVAAAVCAATCLGYLDDVQRK